MGQEQSNTYNTANGKETVKSSNLPHNDRPYQPNTFQPPSSSNSN